MPVLLVRTVVKESPIHGLGLFADEFIPRGTEIWRFDPLLDRVLPLAELDRLPDHVRLFVEVYSEYFPERGLLVLSGDNDRFTNHAADPNTEVVLPNAPDARVIATRDIEVGAEITCDYTVIRTLGYEVVAAMAEGAGEAARAAAGLRTQDPIAGE
ncbi:MAG: SET domain-containing protein [Rhodobacteraceae bacterium]|nr:SET domain-containing protein [Paracoccaceae bacterium]